ncbi:MAG: glucosaminidase domain-containing protein [Chitinophagaceae bacterium]|jgi:flagellum-specific peptidoglycan hydrolase FlgJ|nr:glucosaminidase domain-containing protein [Chitinophagaceae bacterium]
MKLKCLLMLGLVMVLKANSQNEEKIKAYIEKYAPLAINEQVRTGIPAAIKLAQGIHESGAGNGDLALRSNNHFGIKCKSNWTGAVAYHDDDEKGECFRAYDSVAFSYRDHSDFLKTSKRYEFLFKLDITDYKGWANGLKQAGYATNPKYPLLLIKLIENYNLSEFTNTALALQESSYRPPAEETTMKNDSGSH